MTPTPLPLPTPCSARTAGLLPPLLTCLLLLAAGCVSGPSYAGGPTSEEPHGIVSPGADIFIYRVDGRPTTSKSFAVYVAPGRHTLTVRIQHQIDSEEAKPQEYRDVELVVEESTYYALDLKPGSGVPGELLVREAPLR